MNVVVEQHVDDFMTSVSLGAAKTLLEIPDYNIVNSTYTIVQGNSAAWGIDSDDALVNTKVRASSADWDSTYTIVQGNSGSWKSGEMKPLTGNYTFTSSDNGKQLSYTGVDSITAFIDSSINSDLFTVSVTQLGVGQITIKLDPNYTAELITFNEMYNTIGSGTTTSLKRIDNNKFLLSPVFFYIIP